MKIERDERRFDFHDIGLAIKRAREAAGMTQEQLAYHQAGAGGRWNDAGATGLYC